MSPAAEPPGRRGPGGGCAHAVPLSGPGPLEAHLRERRARGRKLLVPYVTAGLTADWTEVVAALAEAGADAIEVGIPFSDPVMDGPVIQEASQRALGRGVDPPGLLSELTSVDAGVPLATMLYYNLVFRAGHRRFAAALADAGVAGCIVPDLPLEESGPWCEAADAAGVETVMLAAPTAPDERLPRICARSRGFVYAVGLLGVTGERATLAAHRHRHGGAPQGGDRSTRARRRRRVGRRPGGRGGAGGRRGGHRLGPRAPPAGGRRARGGGLVHRRDPGGARCQLRLTAHRRVVPRAADRRRERQLARR